MRILPLRIHLHESSDPATFLREGYGEIRKGCHCWEIRYKEWKERIWFVCSLFSLLRSYIIILVYLYLYGDGVLKLTFGFFYLSFCRFGDRSELWPVAWSSAAVAVCDRAY